MLTVAPINDPDDRTDRTVVLPDITVEARPAAPRPAAPLRIVTDDELRGEAREAARRRLARRAGLAVLVAGAAVVFAIAAAHVLLMQGQFELQELESRSAESQAEFDRLRLEVAQLESPDRIVATAQDRLGMIAPEKVTYLAPSTDPAAMPARRPTPSRAVRTRDGETPVDWTTVKSHLAGD